MSEDVYLLDLLGLPYLKHSRGPDAYDCYGLCLEVCRRAGVVIPEIPTPASRADRNDLLCSTKQICQRLPGPQAWCIAAFRCKRNWHAGVVLPDLVTFIHIMAGIRVTISRLDDFKWRQRFDGFYRFPDNPDIESL